MFYKQENFTNLTHTLRSQSVLPVKPMLDSFGGRCTGGRIFRMDFGQILNIFCIFLLIFDRS